MRKRILWAVLAAVVLMLSFVFWGGNAAPERVATSEDTVVRAVAERSTEIQAPPSEIVGEPAENEPILLHHVPSKNPPREDESAVRALGRGTGAYTFTLDVTVLDGFDHPLAGAVVYVAPRLHPLDVAGATNDAGRASIVWRGHLPAMDATVAVAGPKGSWSGLFRVLATTGIPVALQLALPSEKRFEDFAEHARRVQQGFYEGSTSPEALARVAALRLQESEGGRSMQNAGDEKLFVADPAGNAEDLINDFFERWEKLRRLHHLGYTTPVSTTDGGGARVVGTVFDIAGRPAVGALVSIGEEPDSPMHGVYTNDAGRFEFDDVREGTWHARAGGGDHGRASSFRPFSAGETVTWDFILEPGDEIAGELLDMDNKPRAGAWIELVGGGVESAWNDFTETGDDGVFVFENVGEGELELRVHATADVSSLPSFTAAVDREVRFAGLREPALEPGELTLRFPDYKETRVASGWKPSEGDEDVLEARVWQIQTQRGVFLDASRGSASLSLPPGAYEIEIGSSQRGWTQRQILLEAGEAQVVEARFPEGGSVSWVQERGARAFDHYRLIELREDVNSIVASFGNRLPARFELPAGQYELVAYRRDAAAHVVSFRVDDDHETVVTLVTQ